MTSPLIAQLRKAVEQPEVYQAEQKFSAQKISQILIGELSKYKVSVDQTR